MKMFFIIIFSIIFFTLAGSLNKNTNKPKVNLSKQTTAFNFNNKLLKVFDLGQRRLLADIFWITTLLESDMSHYKQKDLNSWLYLRFKTISNLDPLFLRNYQFGGQYLSIIKDDILGAEDIFQTGLSYYPNNYELIFNAAFLYAFEKADYDKASELYQKLVDQGKAPSYIKSLLLKFKYQNHNDLELAYKLVEGTLETTKEGTVLYNKLHDDLYSIRATIDLKCLNNNKVICKKYDLEGRAYIFDGTKWNAQKDFNPYQIFNKKREE